MWIGKDYSTSPSLVPSATGRDTFQVDKVHPSPVQPGLDRLSITSNLYFATSSECFCTSHVFIKRSVSLELSDGSVQKKFLASRFCHQQEIDGSCSPEHSLADLLDELVLICGFKQ